MTFDLQSECPAGLLLRPGAELLLSGGLRQHGSAGEPGPILPGPVEQREARGEPFV